MSVQSRVAVVSNLSQDPRVQVALLDYFERVDRGESVDPEAFLARHAEVSGELRSLIAVDEEARRLAGAASPIADSPPAATVPPVRSKAEVSTHSVVGKVVETVKPTPGNQVPKGEAASESMPRRSVVAPSPKSPPPRSPNDLPEKFGRYQVKQKLGEGAMGAVYLAEDTLLQRKVALKTPTFENDKDGELLKRFYREARAVSKLKHNNLCGVYDVGEIDGRHYISMEFVPGKKLQEFIKPDKPMTEKQAMAVVRKIALAMQEAHTHGVIHRDLKPDNIMVNEKGEPVVMDFGLVHKTESKNSTKLTQQGTLIGSPAYMSKEQVEGDPDKLTGATDQYSLGVILYQLLTSELPFEGGLHAVLGAILTREPPPPSEYRPDLNPKLEAVCLRMMAKEAKDRFPSMKAAAEALADVVRGTSILAGESVVVRGRKGSLNEASLDTTFEETPEAASHGQDDFDFDSAGELPPVRKPPRRKRPQKTRGPLVGGITAGLVLLAAIIWFQFGDARVKVEVLAEGFEVKFNEAEITVTDGLHETRVKPGRHTLHIKSIKSGTDGVVDEFDTELLTLSKGGKPVVSVSIEGGEAVAKLDGKIIPRRSLTVSSTDQATVRPTETSKISPPSNAVGNTSTSASSADLAATTPFPPVPRVAEPVHDPNQELASSRSVLIAELNTSGDDTAAWVSADGLRIYWQQNLVGNDDSKIWQAERASAVEPFGNKKLITDGEQPTLTTDELQMVFIRRDATRNKRLYTASRQAISDKFSSETELKQFGNNLGFNSPFISADGLSLFVNARSTSGTAITDAVYNVSRRNNLADAWPPIVPFNIQWDAVAQKAPLTWIAMEPDELSFLATHELDVGQFRILRFTRSRKTEPFAKYEYLSIPGMSAVYGRAARYIAATRELFLTAPADYAAASSLTGWQAGNHELWVIRDVVLSDSETPLDPSLPLTQPTSETNKIPTDAVVFQKKRFKLLTEELTWQEAKQKCQQMGGRLAEIRSKGENDFVAALATGKTVEGVWLGATDEAQEGRWLWSDGSVATFTNWSPVGKQPNNGGGVGEHYLYMKVKNTDPKTKLAPGEWCDQPNIPKEVRVGYVCEWNSIPSKDSIKLGTAKAGSKSAQVPKAKSTIKSKNIKLIWEGKWTIEKDELVSQGIPMKRQRLVFGDPAWTDYDFKVETMLERARSDGGHMERYFECFNSIPPEKESHWTLNFGGWGPTNLDLRALVPGEEEYQTSSRRWMPAKTHGELGKWTLVEMQARKDQITVLIDGEKVATSKHPMLTRGCIGIGTHHSGQCRWRNFEVRAVDGTVLWTGLPKQN